MENRQIKRPWSSFFRPAVELSFLQNTIPRYTESGVLLVNKEDSGYGANDVNLTLTDDAVYNVYATIILFFLGSFIIFSVNKIMNWNMPRMNLPVWVIF